MTVSVSEKLRDALERLDLAIDRLDAGVAEGNGATPVVESGRSSAAAAIAARLDKIIERVETALAD